MVNAACREVAVLVCVAFWRSVGAPFSPCSGICAASHCDAVFWCNRLRAVLAAGPGGSTPEPGGRFAAPAPAVLELAPTLDAPCAAVRCGPANAAAGADGSFAGAAGGGGPSAPDAAAGFRAGPGIQTTASFTTRLRGQHKRNTSTVGHNGGYSGNRSYSSSPLMYMDTVSWFPVSPLLANAGLQL
jgi:hypothetical protein